jgi:hypothetical protein
MSHTTRFAFTLALIVPAILMATSPIKAALSWQHIPSGSAQLPIPQTSNQQTASLLFDVDKDGDNDFVIASRKDVKAVVWYRRSNTGWVQHVIDDANLRIEAGGDFHDIDGDGDLDITFAGDGGGNFIYWWENPSPNFNPAQKWARHTIKASGANKHHDLLYGDVDGDGKKELVYWNQGEPGLFVSEIPASPKSSSSWPRTKIFTGSAQHEGLALHDLDLDGKLDIIGGGMWFKHTSGTSFQTDTIDSTRDYTRTAVGQLIPGGRPEVVISAGDEAGDIDMYSWNGSGWDKKNLSTVVNGHSLQVVDVDGNGQVDIFSAEMRVNGENATSKIRVFLNIDYPALDKLQKPIPEIVATGFDNHESKVGDLDGDGDMDILGKPYNHETPKLNIWLQTDSGNPPPPPPTSPPTGGRISLDKWQRHEIDANKPWKTNMLSSADIDRDGKTDVVTGGWWYKNPGSPGGNWARKTIGEPLRNMAVLFDVDGQNGMDIIGTKGGTTPIAGIDSSEVVWAQNNGSGTFSIRQNIPNGAGDFVQGAVAGNLQGKQIALSWHRNGGGVQVLTIPDNPATQSWTRSVASTTNQQEALSLGDIDRDGKNDLLLGTKWLKNTGTAWTDQTLYSTTALPDRNKLFDMNNDGRLDAIVGYEAISIAGKLAWYQQPATATQAWTERVIASDIIGPMSVDVADMDGDGDPDVIVGEHHKNQPAQARMFIMENTNGQATAWQKRLVYQGDEHHDGAHVVDIDGDGDLDIASIGWVNNKVVLYENTSAGSTPPPPITNTPPANNSPAPQSSDFNNDGKTNLLDLQLFIANKLQQVLKFDVVGNGGVDIFDYNWLIKKINTGSSSTPQPSITNPPTNPGAKELKLIDREVQFAKSDNGFHVLKANGTNIPGIPINWKSPDDYYNGEWHFRYTLVNQDSTPTAGALSTCIWNMPGFHPENCAGNISHDGKVGTSKTLVSSPKDWWKNGGDPLDFSNSTPFLMRVVLRGETSCNVTSHCVAKPCEPTGEVCTNGKKKGDYTSAFAKYDEMKLRLTIVMVPAGKTFSGWQNYP